MAVLVGMLVRKAFARRDSPVAGDIRLGRSCFLAALVHPVSALAGTEPPLTKPPSVTAQNGPIAILLSTARILPLQKNCLIPAFGTSTRAV
jgi:hypothetical protein